ncbi:hypothetical protein FRC10_000117 [Ceratobasidium sp. 414]|nr:hypothetical protein FRC10_000117 [Ceratobasidium sp. 414]
MGSFDESYNSCMNSSDLSLPFNCGTESLNFNTINDPFWNETYYPAPDYTYADDYAPNALAPATCDPADIMPPPLGFEDILQAGWIEALTTENFYPTPATVNPSQLMTPPQSLPSTPRNVAEPLPLDSSNIGLITPPSDKPVYRTRRFDASDSINLFSQLNLNTSSPVEQTVNPGSLATSSAYTSCMPDDLAVFGQLFTFPPTSSSTFSDASSSSFRGSPPPIRRASRVVGVQRVTASDLRRRNKKNQPVPTSDPERPHGCRHPGRNPGDLPCNLDFARKHDWSRHQRPFKRPDARGRHWDSRPECESTHTSVVRDLLASGEMAMDDRDVPVLRRRAQKAECRRESERTGVPVSELKATMRQVKSEDGWGF